MTISVQKIYHFLSLEISWFSLWTTLGSQIFETRKFLEFQENWFDSETLWRQKSPFDWFAKIYVREFFQFFQPGKMIFQKNVMFLIFLMRNSQLTPCDAFRFVSNSKEHLTWNVSLIVFFKKLFCNSIKFLEYEHKKIII